ncbi:unnamed protein product [Nippostrongylus brasiliensis]|uniref:4F5 domain-containing protein n=1 Tax=Nippostrongylus brasiliensis TaxID=27835 RepID=A0A0N4XNZ3_NIPBR|nr:unnamed protein product [Nippostrongylus brasiliensis]
MIPLQWQTVQSRAPGCYVAPDSKLKMIAMAQGGAKQNMKRTRNQRKRDTMKKKKLKNNKGNPQDSESTAERDHQDTRRPFGSNEEPTSPAGSDVSSQL